MIKLKACERLGMDAFEADMEAGERYIRECCRLTRLTLMTFHIDPITYLKVTGIYDYTLNACPDKHIVHLAIYSKKKRIRWKNFKRAVRIVGRILDEEGCFVGNVPDIPTIEEIEHDSLCETATYAAVIGDSEE